MLIMERNFDIFCISETWLYQDMSGGFINIPNCSVYNQYIQTTTYKNRKRNPYNWHIYDI